MVQLSFSVFLLAASVLCEGVRHGTDEHGDDHSGQLSEVVLCLVIPHNARHYESCGERDDDEPTDNLVDMLGHV